MHLVKLDDDYREPYLEDDGLGAARGLMAGLGFVAAIVVLVGCVWVALAAL